MNKSKAKRFPELASDAESEAFVAEANLEDYDWSDMKRVRFEFAAKDARINMRLPAQLLASIKERAARERIPYQRFIRQVLEGAVDRG
jgi:predicted DNA binding CopG/RHH family protein